MKTQFAYLVKSVLVNHINITFTFTICEIRFNFFCSGYEGESSLSRTVSVVNDDDFDSAPELAELELIHKILKKTKRNRTNPRRSATISHISEVNISQTGFIIFILSSFFRVTRGLVQYILMYKLLLTL